MPDVDIDAPTFTRTLRRAQQLLAVVYDRLTGENGEANTINHKGGVGRGCLLSHPIWQQTFTATATNKDDFMKLGSGRFCLFVVPVYIPPGEDALEVFIEGRFEFTASRPAIDIVNLGGTSRWEALFVSETVTENGGVRLSYLLQVGGATGAVYLRARMPGAWLEELGSSIQLRGAGLLRRRPLAGQPVSVVQPARTDSGTPATQHKTFAQTSPVPWRFRDIDDAMLQDGSSINAWALDAINRNANTLQEAVTGQVIQGNRALNLADSSATQPATPRFFSKTARGFPLEPGMLHPCWTVALGGIRDNGSFAVNASATEGSRDWFAPWLDYQSSGSTTVRTVTFDYLMLPDGITGNMFANVLLSSTAANMSNWELAIYTEPLGFITSWVTPSAVAGLGSGFFRCFFSGIDFEPDDVNAVFIFIRQKTATAVPFDDCSIVGATMWYNL
jgi:hypothetical protein